MTNAFTYRMPAGIPGTISRAAGQATVEPEVANAGTPFPRYGMFGKTAAEKFVPLEAGDGAGAITGLLVRPFPTTSSQDGLGTSTPPTSGLLDRLKRGYMVVTLAKGAAAKDAQVFVVTTAGGTVVVGDIVTSANPAGGGAAVAAAGAFFTGPADANGVVEISYNL
jgi:hypothetical protein